jgi:hypothetical protein
MNPAAKSFAMASLIALSFSSSKPWRCCYTGLEPGLILKVCSATSLRMPNISEGFHVKTLLFARRMLTSMLSYLAERSAPKCLIVGAARVYEDHLGGLCMLKRLG